MAAGIAERLVLKLFIHAHVFQIQLLSSASRGLSQCGTQRERNALRHEKVKGKR